MGFVNEPIPRDQKQTYEIPGYRAITPGQRTIDKEKNVFLFKYWTNIDNPNEKYFAFYWKGICFKVVMLSSFVDGYTIKWGLLSLEQAEKKDLLIDKKSVLNDLREAFKVYGAFGYESLTGLSIIEGLLKDLNSFLARSEKKKRMQTGEYILPKQL